MWLAEGLASYAESRVAAETDGFNREVFARGGNSGLDVEARRHLATGYGRDAIDAVGTARIPAGIHRDRENVARPFYVLSQSFVKFLVERAGLEAVVRLHRGGEEVVGGRGVGAWKRVWAEGLGE